jgi:hypothetical protein
MVAVFAPLIRIQEPRLPVFCWLSATGRVAVALGLERAGLAVAHAYVRHHSLPLRMAAIRI